MAASRVGRALLLAGLLAAALLVGRAVPGSFAGVGGTVAPHWSLPRPERVIAVGDASCWPIQRSERWCRMAEVAPLADGADLLLLLGDIAQDAGRADEYRHGFDPTWGHLVGRAFPVAGNHDYGTPGAAPYFAYWGDRAGEPGRGFYSVDLSGWRIYGLNSNCGHVGCGPDSAQWRWLRSRLQTDPGCSLAMFHHPYRSSVDFFEPAQAVGVEPLYRLLIDARVPLVLTGHAHMYERIALGGRTEQVTAGTGGYGFHPLVADRRIEGSLAALESTFGVLELRLEDHSYASVFRSIDGRRFDPHERPCGSEDGGPTAN